MSLTTHEEATRSWESAVDMMAAGIEAVTMLLMTCNHLALVQALFFKPL